MLELIWPNNCEAPPHPASLTMQASRMPRLQHWCWDPNPAWRCKSSKARDVYGVIVHSRPECVCLGCADYRPVCVGSACTGIGRTASAPWCCWQLSLKRWQAPAVQKAQPGAGAAPSHPLRDDGSASPHDVRLASPNRPQGWGQASRGHLWPQPPGWGQESWGRLCPQRHCPGQRSQPAAAHSCGRCLAPDSAPAQAQQLPR